MIQRVVRALLDGLDFVWCLVVVLPLSFVWPLIDFLLPVLFVGELAGSLFLAMKLAPTLTWPQLFALDVAIGILTGLLVYVNMRFGVGDDHGESMLFGVMFGTIWMFQVLVMMLVSCLPPSWGAQH